MNEPGRGTATTGGERTAALMAFLGLFALGAVLVAAGLVLALTGNPMGLLVMTTGAGAAVAAPYQGARLSGWSVPWLATVVASGGFGLFAVAGYGISLAADEAGWHFAGFSAGIGFAAATSIRPPNRRAVGARAGVLALLTAVTLVVPPSGPFIAYPVLAAPAVLLADAGASRLDRTRSGSR